VGCKARLRELHRLRAAARAEAAALGGADFRTALRHAVVADLYSDRLTTRQRAALNAWLRRQRQGD